MEVRGRFEAPLMGGTHAPAGIVGEGTLSTTATGLRVSALVEGRGWMNGLGCLGATIGFVAVTVLVGVLGDAHVPDIVTKVFGGLVFFGLLFGGFALGKRIGRARPISVELAWQSVRNAHLEAGALVFDSKARPKGRVWFHPSAEERAAAEQLLREMTSAAK